MTEEKIEFKEKSGKRNLKTEISALIDEFGFEEVSKAVAEKSERNDPDKDTLVSSNALLDGPEGETSGQAEQVEAVDLLIGKQKETAVPPEPEAAQEREAIEQIKETSQDAESLLDVSFQAAGAHRRNSRKALKVLLALSFLTVLIRFSGMIFPGRSQPGEELYYYAVSNAEIAALLTQSAVTPQEWEDIVSYWNDAVKTLERIRPGSEVYEMAQSKLALYQVNLRYAEGQIDPFREAVNLAMKAAELVNSAQSASDWQNAVTYWQKTIDLMQAVEAESPHFAEAERKIKEYRRNLKYSKERLRLANLHVDD